MGNLILAVVLAGVMGLCCQQNESSSRVAVDLNASQVLEDDSSLFDFINDCTDLQLWYGSIQGVDNSVSSKVYPMGECYSNRSYDMIWVFRGKKKYSLEQLQQVFENEKELNYPSFDCYVFEINKKKLEELENEFDSKYIFPCSVEIFKRDVDTWSNLGKRSVNNMEEYGLLRVEILQ